MKNSNNLIASIRVRVAVLVFFMMGAITLHAEERGHINKILVLNSYHAGYKGSDDIVTGFSETLRQSFPDVDIIIEYLDSKNHSGPEYDRRVFDMLQYKYKNQSFDLIVSTDDYAFNVLEQHHEELFGKTPVVFCGTNDFDANRIKNKLNFIGIDERPSFTETLELIFRLHPKTKEVIVIHDETLTGQLNSADFRKAASPFESGVRFSYLSGKKLEELMSKVSRLPHDAIIMCFASTVQMVDGENLSSNAALKLISGASTVPIYGGWEFNLGEGIVGGKLINLHEHGRTAAHLVEMVLKGEALTGLETLQPSPNLYMFDYAVFSRFNIPESKLPEGSTIINRPPTFWSIYGTLLLSLLSAILTLLVIVTLRKLQINHKNLKQSQSKFSSMVNAFDGLIYVCSPDYRIEFMNEQLIKRTGHDATGELCYKALHDLDSVCPWCKNDQVLAGENIQWEIKSPKDDRWYHVSNTPMKNADGTISKEALITDITARKRAEEEREQFFTFFMTSADLMCIADPNGAFLKTNPSCTEILGYTEEELISRPFIEFIHPEDKQSTLDEMAKQLQRGYSLNFENRYLCKDGSVKWLSWRATYVKHDGFTYATARDITKRRQAEIALMESELRFRSLMVDIPSVAVQGYTLDGTVAFWNKASELLYGYSSEEAFGANLLDLIIPTEMREGVTGAIQQMIESGEPIPAGELLLKRKDGSRVPVFSSHVLLNLVGRQSELFCLDIDLTERKQAAEALKKAYDELEQRVKERTLELQKTHEMLLHAEKLSAIGSLSASIAHEFNNPLQGVMSIIKGVARRAIFDKENSQLMAMAIDECHRMRDLIKSLQEFNRPTSGRVAAIDVHAIINSILLIGKKEYQTRGITVDTNFAINMPQIKAVGDQIKQVVLNLLNNAAYACSKGGTITIDTEVHEGKVSLRIHDTGVGIKPEDIDHIFEPFFTTKPSIKGTGLGLSVSYGIIKKHGGTISVDSELGKGTTFLVVLPIKGYTNNDQKNSAG